MAVPIRSPDEIDRIARTGGILWTILGEVLAACRPGVRSRDLDVLARDRIAAAGAEPVLLGYSQSGLPPFPGAACVCINEEALHAPPSARLLRAGDAVTIDLAIRLDGWCADAARSVVVPGDPGAAPPGSTAGRVESLVRAAARAAEAAAAAMRPGGRWSAVATAMAQAADEAGCALIAGYHGHGIGRALHEAPRAWSCPGPGGADCPDFVLRPGMVLTVEPILTLGEPQTIGLDDGWTVVTSDRAPVCHEERTVAVVRTGSRVLTAPAARL